MLRDDCTKSFWKEKFINGLPSLFAHKIQDVLSQRTGIIEYDNLTYGDIISTIQKEGLRMCINLKLSQKAAKDKHKAKYELGNYCEQYALPPVAPSRRKNNKKKSSRKYYTKNKYLGGDSVSGKAVHVWHFFSKICFSKRFAGFGLLGSDLEP